jgi:tetratricopeptide (TPR) repeat protein
MPIWSAEIKELESLYTLIKGRFPELEQELRYLIKTDDKNVILLYSRRCLEVIITELCENELNRERGTEPLKGIIDKLNKEKKVPSNIITSMDHLNSLSAYGAHPKDFDPEQVKPVLNNLGIIIKWYLKYKGKDIKAQIEEETQIREELSEKVTKQGRIELQDKPIKLSKRKLLYGVLITAILIIVALFAYPKIFKQNTLEKLRSSGERISVAVMPFQNITNDTVWNVWQDGIQDILITYLSNSPEELKVKQPEAISNLIQSKKLVNYASLTPSIASKISQKLEANIFVYGSIIKAGSTLRLNAQLIDSDTEEAIKSFEVEGPAREESIFQITDSLKQMVRNFLMLSVLEKDVPAMYKFSDITDSPNAFRYFIYGNKSLYKRDYPTAIDWYLKSLAADSTFYYAASYLSVAYASQGSFDQGKKLILDIFEKRDQMPLSIKTIVAWTYAMYFETPHEQIKYLNQYLEIDDQNAFKYWLLGNAYADLNQFDKAIPAYEKSLELYKQWEIRPSWFYNYYRLGIVYHTTGQFRKEKKLYKKAEHDFPGDNLLVYRQAILALSKGRTKQAEKYIEKYVSVHKERSATDAEIAIDLAGIYEKAGILDRAEEYYRKALSLEPDDPDRLNYLAWFLIDYDRNIDEGIDLVNRALELSPNEYYMLDTKGWGLYKQGKYQEALEMLQKSWDLYPIYDNEAYLHLEAAKKAVAEQKND